jgi:hypothetical protein
VKDVEEITYTVRNENLDYAAGSAAEIIPTDSLDELNTVETLGTQLFQGSKPTRGKLKKPFNDLHNKPRGGIWTSNFKEDIGSAWLEWCRSESFRRPPFKCWKLEPTNGNTIVVVDDMVDALKLVGLTGPNPCFIRPTPDWEKLMELGVDAVHLTSEGQKNTRFVDPSKPEFYGWDCESTVWFNWCFKDGVEKTVFH